MTAGRMINTKSKDWGTPLKYVLAVKNVFGGTIDLDPCSNDYSIVGANTEIRQPKQDGLLHVWNHPTIYVNPPYGRDPERGTSIKNWLHKCEEANRKYNSEVIALIPVATNTRHWKDYIYGKAAAICFLFDTRLRFLENGEDVGKGAPMSCAIIYWGQDFRKFRDIFIEHGAIIDGSHIEIIHSKSKQKKSELDLFSVA